jgi:L-gulonolactone oxidase
VHGAQRATLPVDLPSAAMNPLTLRTFNAAYYALKAARRGRRRMHYDSAFFPLDAIGQWNRLYGKNGFYQHQCVIPEAAARDGVAELLRQISRSGQGSFLVVLKSFGDLPSPGMLSFPMAGATLALDFQNGGGETLALLGRLDDVVREAGGRLYPAKDARMGRAMFEAGYPQLDAFRRFRDPLCQSDFARRMML